jgi:hypothetical protein
VSNISTKVTYNDKEGRRKEHNKRWVDGMNNLFLRVEVGEAGQAQGLIIKTLWRPGIFNRKQTEPPHQTRSCQERAEGRGNVHRMFRLYQVCIGKCGSDSFIES